MDESLALSILIGLFLLGPVIIGAYMMHGCGKEDDAE